MASKRILTVFGATGNQGGSVIEAVLAHPNLAQKYALRGITRDTASSKSKALASKGVEMVKAELGDAESLKAATKGSYGVFAVTDYWSVMSKDVEIQQGKSIFEAAKSQGVKHLVFSTLPSAQKVSEGQLNHVDHYESKAAVGEYIEVNKGDMIASYYMPAMFMAFGQLVKIFNGTPTMSLPFPSDSIAWPLIDIQADTGKYVVGLFEGGASANGARVQAVTEWTTPAAVVSTLSKESGKQVVFNPIPKEVFASFLPPPVANELTENMLLIGEYSYYGKGTEKNQAESDKWLISEKSSVAQWAKANGPWNFE